MIITYIILGVTIAISLLALQRPEITDRLLHAPYIESHKNQYYRLLTSGFLHGSMNHLFINMFVLYQFGTFVEQYFTIRFGQSYGIFLFVLFYLSAIVVANMGTFFKHQSNPSFRSLGASGVTSALVLIYCLFDPWQMFIFPPVPAILFAVLYLGYSQWAIKNSSDNIDHQGHLWGSLYGIIFIIIVDPEMLSIFINKIKTLPF